jgi:heat shock protein HslJ
MMWGGELTRLEGQAFFKDCSDGNVYAFAENDELDRMMVAISTGIDRTDGRTYVTFEGELIEVDASGEGRTGPQMKVDRFIRAWPGQRCERARADSSLTNTYWRIVRLLGKELKVEDGQREPHLVLRNEDAHPSCSTTVGCNQIFGGYEIEGDQIKFGPMMTTLMACPPPLDALESDLIAALDRSARYHILAHTMELYDENGSPVALFEAVYL